jgi:hypothetical protein
MSIRSIIQSVRDNRYYSYCQSQDPTQRYIAPCVTRRFSQFCDAALQRVRDSLWASRTAGQCPVHGWPGMNGDCVRCRNEYPDESADPAQCRNGHRFTVAQIVCQNCGVARSDSIYIEEV